MMQAAEAPERLNSLFNARGRSHWALGRRILGEPEVGSVLMVIPDVLGHEAFQMAFVQNDHMIQQISAAASHPALGNSVLPRLRNAVRMGSLPNVLAASITSLPNFES